MTETIKVEQHQRAVATIVLNRPDRGNAFNQQMLDELYGVVKGLALNDTVRVLVLRGEGKHFCTGADMGGRGEGAGGVTLGQVLEALDTFPKPTICVVQGGCIGGGLAMAACCDAVIAEDAAFFSVPELRVGIAPSRELSTYFMRAIGARAFRRYGLSGERIGAAEALRIGLAHEAPATGDTGEALSRLIDAFLHGAPKATGELKRRIAHIASGAPAPKEEEKRGMDRSEESREGVAAFREKRKPAWYRHE
ncbi:MAG: enoyl-CoA hydratase-related protein [Beijerinckiaceae bacterium]